ncbi:MAG: polysaccharide deacetylase family protein [Anaerolineae bacterium]|nr:polysaccharide deacetylase family protein [Anaerolineae bacterium]
MKRAYLTIDDAPSRDFMPKMEYLHRRNIPAIFFCEGKRIRGNEEALQAAIQRGFLLGNHSYSHPHFSDLPVEECQQEILKTDELMDSLYRSAGVERPAKYFRFPYFDAGDSASGTAYESGQSAPSEMLQRKYDDKRQKLQEYLRELGYRRPPFEGVNSRYFGPALFSGVDVRCTYDQAEYWWNKADAPWGLSSEAAILARIEENDPYNGRPLNCDDTVNIILVHDHKETTGLFYKIIARYIEKGIQFLDIPH